MKVQSESEVTQSCLTLGDPMDCSLPRLLRPWDFPGKSTGVGCHCLLHLWVSDDHILSGIMSVLVAVVDLEFQEVIGLLTIQCE